MLSLSSFYSKKSLTLNINISRISRARSFRLPVKIQINLHNLHSIYVGISTSLKCRCPNPTLIEVHTTAHII